jgi:signal transduction histidine kinase
VKRLNDFITNIIRYSRNNRIVPLKETFSPIELFNVAKDLLSYSDRGHRVRFLYYNPGNVNLHSDRERWQVVVNNLFSNSVKFSRDVEDAYVKLSVSSDNDNTYVAVEDNGIGIAKEQIASVFEMFYKGEGPQSGSGLGLFIVRQTLEAMGCRIRVESAINYKTTFTITIPNTAQHDPQRNT